MRFTILFFNTLTRCRFLRQLARISDIRHVYKYKERIPNVPGHQGYMHKLRSVIASVFNLHTT